MPHPLVRLYFDFIDPLSYVVSHALTGRHRSAEADPKPRIEWVGFELRPPPLHLTETRDPMWSERWERASVWASGLDLSLDRPRLVPWTRKALELHVFASLQGAGEAVRLAILEAYFSQGHDIGRVDVLVDIAVAAGLDRTGTKAVLDVDRHEVDVASARREALVLGATDVPSLSVDGRLVEGFPDPTDLGTLLPDS